MRYLDMTSPLLVISKFGTPMLDNPPPLIAIASVLEARLDVNGLPKRSQHYGTGGTGLEIRVAAGASPCKWKVLRLS